MRTLMYHNILSQSPGVALATIAEQVTLEQFRRQLKSIHRSVIHPLEADAQMRRGKTTRGILLTFDDGALGLLAASTVLAEMNLAAVAFVCPGAIERGLWFYRLAYALAMTTAVQLAGFPLNSLPARNHAYYQLLSEMGSLPADARDARLERLVSELQVATGNGSRIFYDVMNAEEMRRAASGGHLIFANHTWSHPDLEGLPADEVNREIQAAHVWLSDSGLPYLPWLAFPRGRYRDDTVRAALQHSVAVFGANAFETHAQVWPRVGVYAADGQPIRFWLKTRTPLAGLLCRRNAREARVY